ncbi:MAG: LD-carboxypeptidase [Rhodospirillales bacterium]|nr:LD-carboxypeptidase [Rhodospirillales bacterium]
MSHPPILPPALRPGDTIGIMAPSSRANPDSIEKSAALLKENGYNVFIHPQTYETCNQSAGSPDQKCSALRELLLNPDIKAIISACGGNRSGLMLDGIDYGLLLSHPKIIMGFSDLTVLLNGLYTKVGLIGFHGPDMGRLFRLDKKYLDQGISLLSGKAQSLFLENGKVIAAGQSEGHLVGGCLSVFMSLMGTPYQPDFNGAILFIEDVGDELSRYDRMLIHLRNTGVFDQISGLILGDFGKPLDTGMPFGFTLEDIVREHTSDRDIPVIMNAPFGHLGQLLTFPVGGKARLTANADKCTLELTDPVVAV